MADNVHDLSYFRRRKDNPKPSSRDWYRLAAWHTVQASTIQDLVFLLSAVELVDLKTGIVEYDEALLSRACRMSPEELRQAAENMTKTRQIHAMKIDHENGIIRFELFPFKSGK